MTTLLEQLQNDVDLVNPDVPSVMTCTTSAREAPQTINGSKGDRSFQKDTQLIGEFNDYDLEFGANVSEFYQNVLPNVRSVQDVDGVKYFIERILTDPLNAYARFLLKRRV